MNQQFPQTHLNTPLINQTLYEHPLLASPFSTAPSTPSTLSQDIQQSQSHSQQPAPQQQLTSQKPKRRQVKNACVNCQKACKKCDEGRPCQRCIKYGLTETCRDSIRKERKKGIKRGPYKRRPQNQGNNTSTPSTSAQSYQQSFSQSFSPSSGFTMNNEQQEIMQAYTQASLAYAAQAKIDVPYGRAYGTVTPYPYGTPVSRQSPAPVSVAESSGSAVPVSQDARLLTLSQACDLLDNDGNQIQQQPQQQHRNPSRSSSMNSLHSPPLSPEQNEQQESPSASFYRNKLGVQSSEMLGSYMPPTTMTTQQTLQIQQQQGGVYSTPQSSPIQAHEASFVVSASPPQPLLRYQPTSRPALNFAQYQQQRQQRSPILHGVAARRQASPSTTSESSVSSPENTPDHHPHLYHSTAQNHVPLIHTALSNSITYSSLDDQDAYQSKSMFVETMDNLPQELHVQYPVYQQQQQPSSQPQQQEQQAYAQHHFSTSW